MVGVVLIIGLTVMGVTGIMIFGASAISDAHTKSEIDAAEHAMTQLDSKFSLVALGSADRQGSTVGLRGGATLRVDGEQGWMNVSVNDRAAGNYTVLNVTLGAIVYENDGTSVAYQGGGVWKRTTADGSTMVSPPEFHYRTRGGDDPTLTLPLVTVRGSGTLTEQATVSKDATVGAYPVDGDPDRANPLTGGEINVTVHSEYYRAWGTFFEERTGGSVTYDHERERVTITMVIEGTAKNVNGGIVSGASGTELEFKNLAETDSYNSSDGGDYSSTVGDNTSIITTGSISVGNNAKIHGNVEAGGSVSIDPNGEVTGTVEEHAEVAAPSAVDWMIDERIDYLSDPDNNDNSDDTITDDSFTDCDPCELDAGEYYLDEIDLDGDDTLTLDTSSGDVEIAIAGDVSLGGATVQVTGDNTTRFFIGKDATIGGDGEVTVPSERSTGMWFYMNPGATFSMGNGAEFTGVVYGPGEGAQPGVDIDLSNHVKVWGGLVGDIGYINNHMDIHFDEALVGVDPLEGRTANRPTLTYLHVTENRVNVSSR